MDLNVLDVETDSSVTLKTNVLRILVKNLVRTGTASNVTLRMEFR